MATPNDIYNEITRIDNAKQGIAEAIEEKGVQVPDGTPIQDFPGKVRQIQTGSPDAVLYTPQDLTPEQQEQARTNIGATAPEIFWATYGTTTAAEIQAAMDAGKIVACLYNGHIYIFSGVYTATSAYSWYYFASTYNDQSYYVRCRSDNNTWGNASYTLQSTAHRVNELSGNETATNKYPSTKAVADFAVQSLTASGKKIWAGTQAEFDLLTPSNDTIYFIIPAL